MKWKFQYFNFNTVGCIPRCGHRKCFQNIKCATVFICLCFRLYTAHCTYSTYVNKRKASADDVATLYFTECLNCLLSIANSQLQSRNANWHIQRNYKRCMCRHHEFYAIFINRSNNFSLHKQNYPTRLSDLENKVSRFLIKTKNSCRYIFAM